LERSEPNSSIVKCSHCRKILSVDKFKTHKCENYLIDVRTIPVINFSDTSCNGRKIMTGWGLDGILYAFEVVPRKAIPIVMRLSDGSYHDKEPDDKLPEPTLAIFNSLELCA
jgi:hypothetical protein